MIGAVALAPATMVNAARNACKCKAPGQACARGVGDASNEIVCRSAAAALGLAALAGCVAPVGPVEVTRFHVPEIGQLGRGTIAVEPAAGRTAAASNSAAMPPRSRASWRCSAIPMPTTRRASRPDRDLAAGAAELSPGSRARGPVSVGVGGSTGSYGSGVGVGIGLDLSGPPPEQVETLLGVTIKDRASGRALWEGRASIRRARQLAAGPDPARRGETGGSAVPGLPRAVRRNYPGEMTDIKITAAFDSGNIEVLSIAGAKRGWRSARTATPNSSSGSISAWRAAQAASWTLRLTGLNQAGLSRRLARLPRRGVRRPVILGPRRDELGQGGRRRHADHPLHARQRHLLVRLFRALFDRAAPRSGRRGSQAEGVAHRALGASHRGPADRLPREWARARRRSG